MSKNELIRQNINFMEYPLWFQNQELAKNAEGYVWKEREGYLYQTGYKPPVKVDMIFLLYLLMKSQQEEWSEIIELSRFEILKGCGAGTDRYWYERLKDSLHRWSSVLITFEGTFYDGKSYKTMQFGTIDSWKLEEGTKKLRIRFSPEWLENIKHSDFVKMLNFKQVKELRSPLATRLYELLIKTFKGRNSWSIDSKKLAKKIPMSEQYPAHIIPKIKTAVGRINQKTDLQINLTIRRPQRGKAIFDFEKLETEASKPPNESAVEILDVPEEKRAGLAALLELIPSEHRQKKTIQGAITRFLRKKGKEYVERNILYTNESAKKNYRVFLSKALREDWGVGFIEERQEAQKQKQSQEAEAAKQRQKEHEEERLQQLVYQDLESMSDKEKAQLEEEAKAGLTSEMLKSSFASSLIKMQMRAILAKQIQIKLSPSDK